MLEPQWVPFMKFYLSTQCSKCQITHQLTISHQCNPRLHRRQKFHQTVILVMKCVSFFKWMMAVLPMPQWMNPDPSLRCMMFGCWCLTWSHVWDGAVVVNPCSGWGLLLPTLRGYRLTCVLQLEIPGYNGMAWFDLIVTGSYCGLWEWIKLVNMWRSRLVVMTN